MKKVSTPKIHLRCDSGGAGWWKAYRRTPSHKGIDYKCLEGEAIRAWGDGSVLRKGYDRRGYGYWLETSQMLNGVPRVMLTSKTLRAKMTSAKGTSSASVGELEMSHKTYRLTSILKLVTRADNKIRCLCSRVSVSK